MSIFGTTQFCQYHLLADAMYIFKKQLHRFICYSPTHPPNCKVRSSFLVGGEWCASVLFAHHPAASFVTCGFVSWITTGFHPSVTFLGVTSRCPPAAPD